MKKHPIKNSKQSILVAVLALTGLTAEAKAQMHEPTTAKPIIQCVTQKGVIREYYEFQILSYGQCFQGRNLMQTHCRGGRMKVKKVKEIRGYPTTLSVVVQEIFHLVHAKGGVFSKMDASIGLGVLSGASYHPRTRNSRDPDVSWYWTFKGSDQRIQCTSPNY